MEEMTVTGGKGTFKDRPFRVSEMTVGNTLFTVISVQSENAKETPCDKVKRLILEHSRDIPDSATKNSQ